LSSHLFVEGALHEGHRLGVLRSVIRLPISTSQAAREGSGVRRSGRRDAGAHIFDAVWAQFHRAVDQLAERFPEATAMLSDAGSDILAFTTCPQAPWTQIRSINPQSV
jgi:hypothetical protein